MAKQIRLRVQELRRLREIQERRPILLEEIAEKTGLSYSTVSRWTTDKPISINKDILVTFADYFGVDPLEVLEVVDESDPSYKAAPAVA